MPAVDFQRKEFPIRAVLDMKGQIAQAESKILFSIKHIDS